jgi:hypothetical protein
LIFLLYYDDKPGLMEAVGLLLGGDGENIVFTPEYRNEMPRI